MSSTQNKAYLMATAKEVASRLKLRSEGTQLRIHNPSYSGETNTSGWCAEIGNLGTGQPWLEIWLDKFSGHEERKLFACFHANNTKSIKLLADQVSRKLWAVRTVSPSDTVKSKHLVLIKRIARSEFNAPIFETYKGGVSFFGIYDETKATSERVNPYFCDRAVAFFEDVARALPNAIAEVEQFEDFPKIENRTRVASHLTRERSRLLAAECKIRDAHQCQVCSFNFSDKYGKLGVQYAEAHHVVPLSKLTGPTKTSLADLITVCANCHRMLHRMEGNQGDVKKLKTIVQKSLGK